MPYEVGRFFYGRCRMWIAPESVLVGELLGLHTARGGDLMRDRVECHVVIVPDDRTVQDTGERSSI